MQHILSYKDGAAKLLLAPGMSVPGLGSIQTLESSYMRGSGGKAFAGARVATGSGNVPGIIAGDGSVVEPVLFATKLDGRRFNAAYVSDVNGDRVIVMVQFVDGTRGIYANVGAAEEELRLTFIQEIPGTIQFNVPSGATLEAADTVDSEVWTTVNSPEVQTTGSLRFFRLRK